MFTQDARFGQTAGLTCRTVGGLWLAVPAGVMAAPGRSGRLVGRYGAWVPPAAFASFSYRSFRFFWFGGFVANGARFSQYVAIPAVMWELTNSPGWVGLAGFAQFVPMALIAPVAGLLADHYPRRSLLLVTQSLMAIAALILAVAWWQGLRSPVAFVVLAGLTGVVSGLNLPAWQAFVSELVPQELLLNAVTLNSAQFNCSRVVGPMLGGIIVATAGPATAFAVSGAGCVAVLFALGCIESRKVLGARSALNMRPLSNIVAVVRYVRARRGLTVAISSVAVIGSLGLPVQVLMVVFAEDVFDRGPSGYGFMLTIVGIGAVAATPVVASLGGRVRRSRIQRVALVIYGCAILGLSVAPSFGMFLVPLMFVGVAHLTSASALNTTVQMQVDEDMRAQVLSLYVMVLMTSNPIGQLALGQLIELIGAREAFAVYGVALLVITALLHVLKWLNDMDVAVGSYSPDVVPEAHPTTPSPPSPPRPQGRVTQGRVTQGRVNGRVAR